MGCWRRMRHGQQKMPDQAQWGRTQGARGAYCRRQGGGGLAPSSADSAVCDEGHEQGALKDGDIARERRAGSSARPLTPRRREPPTGAAFVYELASTAHDGIIDLVVLMLIQAWRCLLPHLCLVSSFLRLHARILRVYRTCISRNMTAVGSLLEPLKTN